MTPLHYLSVCLGCLLAAINLRGADQPSLMPQLEPLRPFLGKTWKGAFKNSKPDHPMVDIMHWERALNGKAVRVLHSVNDGSYGGETIVMWDEKKQTVTYHYFTTAGFMTVGTMSFQDEKLITHEVVVGNTGGVTEVRGTSELLPGDTLRVKTDHLKDGVWQSGREVVYHQDPDAKVLFK